jgi:hypothetical protein
MTVRVVTHTRPDGVDDDTVAAVGKLSEALEWVERARGRLYDFHKLMGRADVLFCDAADALEAAGHRAEAEAVRRDVVGRNVLDGQWTFQVVVEFDDLYYDAVRACDTLVCDRLMDGRCAPTGSMALEPCSHEPRAPEEPAQLREHTLAVSTGSMHTHNSPIAATSNRGFRQGPASSRPPFAPFVRGARRVGREAGPPTLKEDACPC